MIIAISSIYKIVNYTFEPQNISLIFIPTKFKFFFEYFYFYFYFYCYQIEIYYLLMCLREDHATISCSLKMISW